MATCLHGNWEDGVCKCDRGYVTVFTDTELYPIYCSKKDDVFILNLRKGFEPVDILHYTTMSLTVGLATGSFLGLMFFLYTLLDACLLARRIKKAKEKLEKFRRKQIRRDSTENLNAELWYPDMNVYRCINDPKFTVEKALARKTKKIIYAKVLHDYKPQEAGELRLHAGDTIKDVTRLNKGWCKGNLNGRFGFYPEAYAEMFQPTLDIADEDDYGDEIDTRHRDGRRPLSMGERADLERESITAMCTDEEDKTPDYDMDEGEKTPVFEKESYVTAMSVDEGSEGTYITEDICSSVSKEVRTSRGFSTSEDEGAGQIPAASNDEGAGQIPAMSYEEAAMSGEWSKEKGSDSGSMMTAEFPATLYEEAKIGGQIPAMSDERSKEKGGDSASMMTAELPATSYEGAKIGSQLQIPAMLDERSKEKGGDSRSMRPRSAELPATSYKGAKIGSQIPAMLDEKSKERGSDSRSMRTAQELLGMKKDPGVNKKERAKKTEAQGQTTKEVQNKRSSAEKEKVAGKDRGMKDEGTKKKERVTRMESFSSLVSSLWSEKMRGSSPIMKKGPAAQINEEAKKKILATKYEGAKKRSPATQKDEGAKKRSPATQKDEGAKKRSPATQKDEGAKKRSPATKKDEGASGSTEKDKGTKKKEGHSSSAKKERRGRKENT